MGDFKVVIGDWSDDGHGKTETYVVKVPDRFSSEQLSANYRNNVIIFGFSPESFAAGYEDSRIYVEDAQKLVDAGIGSDVFTGDSFDVYWELQNGSDSMLEICMFFVGYGLRDFMWEKSSESIPVLFGGYNALCGSSVGYGLFY